MLNISVALKAGTTTVKRLARSLWLMPLMLAMVVTVAGCNRDKVGTESPPEPGDIAVARIDGNTIWSSDVRNEAVAQGQIGPGEPLDATSDLFSRTLEEVIDQRLLAKAAKAKGLDKSISAQRRLQAANDRILGDMLVEHTIDRDVDDKAVKSQYDDQVKLSKQSEEISARLILLKTKADADAVMKSLQAGAIFEATAMEKSIDQATRFNGGDMGYFTTDIMPQAYKGVLATAKVGDLAGPVQVDGGWAILKVEDRRPEQLPTLEEERPVIMRYLIYNQVAGLLNSLRDHSKVERLIAKPTDDNDLEPASAPSGGASDSADSSEAGSDSALASSSASAVSKPAPVKAKKVTDNMLLPTKDPTAGHHFFAPAAARSAKSH